MKTINRVRKTSKAISAVLLFIMILLGSYFIYQINNTKIYKRIYIGNIDVSNLSRDQAFQKLKYEIANDGLNYLIFKYGTREWKVSSERFDAKYNIEAAVEKAYSIGRSKGLLKRVSELVNCRFGRNIDVVFNYDKGKLISEISSIKKQIDESKKNASIVSSNNIRRVIPHVAGKSVELDKALELAEESIKNIDSNIITLPVKEEYPEVLESQLLELTDVLGSFVTNFNSGDVSRNHNITLACSRINGMLINPGQVFSADKTILERKAGNGYKLAKAYLNGDIVEEIGGGVCQVATTLYDAVLYANLKVLERKPHTMMVGYVNPGFDATLSDKGIDFKFVNSSNSPIYLYSGVEGNKVIMRIYGKKQDTTIKVKLETEVTEIFYAEPEELLFDSSLKSGIRKIEYTSKNGYKAKLYKRIYKNDILISNELVSENVYKPLRGKIKIGI